MDTTEKLTKEQRDAVFAEISATVVPADAPKPSNEQRILEWLPQLVQARKKGYTPEQLVKLLAHPKVGIDVSVWTVKKALARAGHRRRASKPVEGPATPAAGPKNSGA